MKTIFSVPSSAAPVGESRFSILRLVTSLNQRQIINKLRRREKQASKQGQMFVNASRPFLKCLFLENITARLCLCRLQCFAICFCKNTLTRPVTGPRKAPSEVGSQKWSKSCPAHFLQSVRFSSDLSPKVGATRPDDLPMRWYAGVLNLVVSSWSGSWKMFDDQDWDTHIFRRFVLSFPNKKLDYTSNSVAHEMKCIAQTAQRSASGLILEDPRGRDNH